MKVGYSAEELANWSGGEWRPNAPKKISGISKDTRSLSKDNIYIALKGEKYDGHVFLGDASDKGAAGLIVTRSYVDSVSDISSDKCPILIVDDTRMALCDMAREYRRKVNPVMIGITGSAGKSTVKEMIAQILSKEFDTASTKGNWNNDIGLPMSLLRMETSSEKGVFEVGMNHPGEIGALCGILIPDWGVVTNIGPVHIGFFDSVEAIAEEKSSLLKALPKTGTAVLNMDDEYFGTLKAAVKSNLLTVSSGNDSDYTYVIIEQTGKVLVKEKFSGEEMIYKPTVPGVHNIINAMMAVAVARGQGAGWDSIRSALEEFESLPMRWEEIQAGGIRFINDAYNANPLSMKASIGAFEEEPAKGGKWLVLSGMKELGRMERIEHVQLGEYVGEGDWAGIVVVGSSGEMIARGIRTTGFAQAKLHVCAANDGAVQVLENNLQKGDAVLLKASRGMRLEEVVEVLKEKLT
ncbi:hypothetical protein BVX97_03405 [bacterium E08(2017)]|nr:hypothetical protein BVX97_03405 [bacterium E08(2017)]